MLKIIIEGIDDLMAFVSIVKGETVDVELIKRLTNQINISTNELQKAEENQNVTKSSS